MIKIITSEKVPIKLWLEDIEEGALQQARNLANLPFVFKHVSIMPDSHLGYGMPIGGVMAADGVVVPNAVGVDIGCGMCAVNTGLRCIDTENLKKIMQKIRQVVPVGFKHHRQKQDSRFMPESLPSGGVSEREWENARTQLGTLGSGNHFIEIQRDSGGVIWVMIHSGSRNIGKQVADHYNTVASSLNGKWHTTIPKSWNLAFLPIDSKEGDAYLREMDYCVRFALANRKLMLDRVLDVFHTETRTDKHAEETINIAHNYASMEEHFGRMVMVHRKGATLARKGTIGIIPGSQGSKSYIVRGKGNKESFCSCSHGAGRKMGRKQAIRSLNMEDELKSLEERNIIHAVRGKKDLDEAPGAYKNIAYVMENQKDLVEILVELSPLAVIKG